MAAKLCSSCAAALLSHPCLPHAHSCASSTRETADTFLQQEVGTLLMLPSVLLAGLVFFAFAFNMVDCGACLGGRLGEDKHLQASSIKKSKVRYPEGHWPSTYPL